ncbi:MAG TPA: class I SAM-dependent methyltransferase [Polyangiaceae bacterium]
MDASGSQKSNRAYYDAFSERYEAHRGSNDPHGYHQLIDELESDFVGRYAVERDVLEVGCGTGLLLERIQRFARSAKGVDLSPRMLEKARQRGLDVQEGSATELPFADESFDVTCSFKVLSHVPEVNRALCEMARVTRPGGMILAEFYNPLSLRWLVKRMGPTGRISEDSDESQVYTRYHFPFAVRRLLPLGCEIVGSRGVRVLLPAAGLMRRRTLGRAFWTLERALCDSPLRVFGGFWIAAIRKRALA